MRFTTGQMPSAPSRAPAARAITPAEASHFTLDHEGRSLRSRPPAIRPRIMVPSVGMKLRVAYPPPLKRKGFERGNKLSNQVSKAQARLLFLFQ